MIPNTYVTKPRISTAVRYNHTKPLPKLSQKIRPFAGDCSISGFCSCGWASSSHVEVYQPVGGSPGYWQRVCPGNWIVEEASPSGIKDILILTDEEFNYWYKPYEEVDDGNTDT